jgi:hypothetical protein
VKLEYIQTAINDRIIRCWCASGQFTNIAHGKYRKKDPP